MRPSPMESFKACLTVAVGLSHYRCCCCTHYDWYQHAQCHCIAMDWKLKWNLGQLCNVYWFREVPKDGVLFSSENGGCVWWSLTLINWGLKISAVSMWLFRFDLLVYRAKRLWIWRWKFHKVFWCTFYAVSHWDTETVFPQCTYHESTAPRLLFFWQWSGHSPFCFSRQT